MDELSADPVLSELIEEYGRLHLDAGVDPFERLVTSIVNQQLSTASASTIRKRLFGAYEITPRTLVDADEAELRDLGVSYQKIEYIKNTARTFLEDDLSQETFEGMTDSEAIDELIFIRGVGVWTAKIS